MNQEQQFQSFTYGSNNSYETRYSNAIPETNSISLVSAFSWSLEGDAPLLEELQIDPKVILFKTMDFIKSPSSVKQVDDLSGPIVFLLLIAFAMILNSKNPSFIYILALVSILGLYAILNLMSDAPISIYSTASILGYSLIPVVIFGFSVPFIQMTNISLLLFFVASICVFWSSFVASLVFVNVLRYIDLT